ncbi:MAG TPA: acyl-CoA dehydrogenase family protein [Geobacterales bacterium]|nr:acyl-CoA dehydrogenase family protein [Geobacterales bacterium]
MSSIKILMFPFNNSFDFKIEIPEEIEAFRSTIREFSEKYLAPIVNKVEETNEIDEDVFKKAIELGLVGVGIPPEYDGQGGGSLMMAVMIEEISRFLPAFATAIAVNHLFAYPVLAFGSEEQRRKYVTKIAKGEAFAAHANTEPGAGSDVAGIQTTARKEGNKWVINGRKLFITGANRADFLVVSARTSPPPSSKERWKGLSLFIVEKGMPGLKVTSRINTMGLRGEQPYEVILDNVEVPAENIVGEEGNAFKAIVSTYDHGRIGIAAQAVGIMQGLLERTLDYTAMRNAFGRPILSFEAIAFKIADMLINLEAARLLTYWAATLMDKGSKDAIMAASLAKTFATEAAEKASINAIKMHGGYGVVRETGIERSLRDTMITEIYEGANDIQRLTIIRSLVKKRFGVSVDLT